MRPVRYRKKQCAICGERSPLISLQLGVCPLCVRERPDEALSFIERAHRGARGTYGLPPEPPRSADGIPCGVCANECRIGVGESGYCGLKWNVGGRLRSIVGPGKGLLYAYLDPHVTNCCSCWFCPAGTGAGYPKYAYRRGPEFGYYNLAVFFYGCNFDCLYCQNASHKDLGSGKTHTVDDLARRVSASERISCICYFGGSPEPQLPFAIKASRRVLDDNPDRIVRICFEWNGCGNPILVRRAAELALESGGNLKFDLKCFDPTMSLALSGIPNRRAFKNFEMIAEALYDERADLPVLTATTLLVPGYVDKTEVGGIARFIGELNPGIPYSLLIFHPDFLMTDLPVTPVEQVVRCYNEARKYVKRVHVGNLGMLGASSIEELMRVNVRKDQG
ncbi:TPA: radical SAM protein [Candidatus Bathyarchaeota archaeon]|nr:radical SAM protein [Candidatus Bathyarchaeota archaeon]